MTLYTNNARQEMKPFLPKTFLNVLEVGCSDGTFAATLEKNGQIWGIEPNKITAAIASTKLSKVIVGTFDQARNVLPAHFFDLVVCNDVIEHLVDHEKFLYDVQSVMTSNGVLIGAVPNIRYVGALYQLLIKADWPYRDQGVLDRTHLRWFTAKSLRTSLEKNGFSVSQFSGINSDMERAGTIRRIALQALAAVSLGKLYDLRFPQFAFTASLNAFRES